MVIKKITTLRKKEFTNSMLGISSHLRSLDKLGISEVEILDFLHRLVHEQELFTARFYRDEVTGKFIYESNFPDHFEYYKLLITKDVTIEENMDENSL